MVLPFALSDQQVALSFAELLNGLLEGHEMSHGTGREPYRPKRSTFNRLVGRAQKPATEKRKS